MARKKKQDDGGLTGDEWLGTYSDCVTLLLTFFILLYSMSTVDAAKVQAISEAFSMMTGREADSILEFQQYDGNQPVIGGETKYENLGEESSEEEVQSKMYDKVKEYLEKNKLTADIADVTSDKRGVIIELRDNILFDTGKATLKPESKEVLNKINALISTLPNNIVVEGHTDNIPISNSKYPSNWELSTMRATTVVRYFTEVGGEDPSKISAAGYGEYKPVVENTTDENRAKNRRVNILIVANNEE